jgi:hypothetical protein
MMRYTSTLIVAFVALAACKGETVVKPDPQTQADLDSCKNTMSEKDKRIAALQDENAELMRKNGAGGEVVVTIEGNLMTVKPYKGPGNPPVDDKVAAAASKEFYNIVEKSRGAIQKCYEQALKKNTGLQAKTVTLTVMASFGSTGAYKDSAFAPSLGDTFDNCIKTVASRWAMPANPPVSTFKASVSLTPS